METYLFKFSGCLLVLWLVYVLFLERQTMHRFKRFYLLGAVASALIIPMLTITHYIEPIITDFEVAPLFIPIEPVFTEIPLEQAPFWTLENILWMLYGIGVLLFSIRFTVNLFKMYKRISYNETIMNRSFVYVLLEEYRIPHSFFKYIFFNKLKYKEHSIPKEVMLHEETHAKQLHSLDVLVIELLQIIFWFNPLIYILKYHIKLNHEFLADQAVLNQGSDAKTYQNILLQFSSNTQEYQLSSAINYSSIKKRFTVMKTQTSKTRIWLSSLLLLPIIAILFYSFAEKEYVEKETISKSDMSSINGDLSRIAEENFFLKKDFEVPDENGILVKRKFYELPDAEKRKRIYSEQIPFKAKKINQTEFENFRNSQDYVIQINNKTILNIALSDFTTHDFVTYSSTPISGLAEMKERFVINLVTAPVFKSNIENFISMYKNIYPDYEIKLKEPKTAKSELELASIYEFLKYNYDNFTQEIIEENQFLPPTELSAESIKVFEDYYKNIIKIHIDKDKNLFLNSNPTTLETIKNDFDKIKKIETPQVQLTTEGKVNIKFVNKIMSATGASIIVSNSQAEVYDEDLMYAKINGKQINGVGTKLTIPEFKNLKISHKYYDITGFSILLNNNEVYNVNGNTLNSKLNSKIEKLNPNEVITIFKIRNSENVDIAPVLIEIIKQQKIPTTKEVAGYNAWAKQIHAKSKVLSANGTWYPPIDQQNLIKFSVIFNRMSEEQKTKAVDYPFPGLDIKDSISQPPTPQKQEKPIMWILINRHDQLLVDDEIGTLKSIEDKLKKLAKAGKSRRLVFIKYDKETSKEIISQVEAVVKANKFKVESFDASIPPPPPPPTNQEKATAKQVAEYNAWAKKINTAMAKAEDNNDVNAYPIVKVKEVNKYKAIYDSMTAAQKKASEQWPSFPPPPPPPPPPNKTKGGPNANGQHHENVKTGFHQVNGQTLYYTAEKGQTTYYNRWGQKVNRKGDVINSEQTHAEDVIKGQVISKIYKEDKVIAEFNTDNVSIPPPPPPPPAPESTLDFVIRMAKANAKFFYELKPISSDKAIDLLKKKPKLNINARKVETKHPIIYISKKPMLIGVKGKVGEKMPTNVMVNGKKIKSPKLEMTRSEFKNLKLSTKKGKVTGFKFKIPGKPTQSIEGNTIDLKTVKNLESIKKDDNLVLFDIKDGSDLKIEPLVITITD